jgi:hypothetical protein
MRCRACRNDYTGWIIAGCTLDTAAAYMRSMSCPLCGSGAERQVIVTTPSVSSLDPS